MRYGTWSAVGVICMLAAGCPAEPELREFNEADNVTNTAPADEHAHNHEHALGPNGGHLVELGEEDYHAEVLMDEATRKITVYLLGSDAKAAASTDAETVELRLKTDGEPVTIPLAAARMDTDPEGASSRFEYAGDLIPASVHDIEEVQGELAVVIGGTPYSGQITHDHDHGHAH